jgi:23S rRNA (cytidine1920-2'-O)/16S rRNA (cytidine1409-2'-O)-methyltransferase
MKNTGGKERADQMLVDQGLAESKTRAQSLILSGAVYLGERRIDKAGTSLPSESVLVVRSNDLAYVSRGGVKLAGALDAFQIAIEGRVAIDVGASTGGFTDVLLQRGAQQVYAIDVGYGQLHQKLRNDSRVKSFERTNARHMTLQTFGFSEASFDIAVIDASFIGLEKLLPAVGTVTRLGAPIVAMVKPQFQLQARDVGKHGVVKDEEKRQRAAQIVIDCARELGMELLSQVDSSLAGPQGNREIFLHLKR